MNLKLRLMLATILQVGILLAGILLVVYWNQRATLVGRFTAERDFSLRKLARICQATLDAKEERILLSYLQAWMESPDILEVSLWDQSGVVNIHSEFLKGNYSVINQKLDPALLAKARAADSILVEEGRGPSGRVLRAVVPVNSRGKRFGFALVTYDLDRINQDLRAVLDHSVRALLAIGAAGGLAGAVMAWFLAGGLTRPISVLSAAARAIGAGRFPPSIPVRRNDELGMLAEDLTKMSIQLKQHDEFKDSFLRRVSHNMRAPLAAMEGAVFHAEHFLVTAHPAVKDDFRIVERGLRELSAFIGNLLDLERMKAGKMVFRFQSGSVMLLLRQSGEMFHRLAEAKGLQLEVQEKAPLRDIPMDHNLVGQVVGNLVLNAIKFTPEGGRIDLEAVETAEGIRVSVCDTGPGIPPEKIGKVFEKFQQFGSAAGTAAGGTGRGSGLGLALCREVVEAHRGRIWVENLPAGGSAFRFILPFTSAAAEKA